jgi:hypothetical protein
MDQKEKCKRLRDIFRKEYKFLSLYNADFDAFFTSKTPDQKNFSIVPKGAKYEDRVAYILLSKLPTHVNIDIIERLSDTHKGILKKVLQLVICKAAELGLPVKFDAVPGNTNVKQNRSKSKLYKYYNAIGFTRKNNSPGNNNAKSSVSYNTNVASLKKSIDGWPEPEECSSPSCAIMGGRQRITRRKRLILP